MTKENSNNLPREKLALSGAEKLTDAELITILLGSGTQAMNVFDLSQYILNESGGLTQLMDYELHELMDFPGIKAAKHPFSRRHLKLREGSSIARRKNASRQTIRTGFIGIFLIGSEMSDTRSFGFCYWT